MRERDPFSPTPDVVSTSRLPLKLVVSPALLVSRIPSMVPVFSVIDGPLNVTVPPVLF